jgi:ribose 5-phosphate isomerase B
MKIACAFDHAGVPLRQFVFETLTALGHETVDLGVTTTDPVDYPDVARRASEIVLAGDADRAVIVCGSGVGVSIVANKLEGIRAVNAHDPDEAEMSRRHNDANVLTLSGSRLTPEEAGPIVDRFLGTDFDGGRHARRVDKIAAIERDRDRHARYDDEEE